jgi:hypothetical protein
VSTLLGVVGAAGISRPHHEVAHARGDLVVTPGAPVGLAAVRPGHRAHQPVPVGGGPRAGPADRAAEWLGRRGLPWAGRTVPPRHPSSIRRLLRDRGAGGPHPRSQAARTPYARLSRSARFSRPPGSPRPPGSSSRPVRRRARFSPSPGSSSRPVRRRARFSPSARFVVPPGSSSRPVRRRARFVVAPGSSSRPVRRPPRAVARPRGALMRGPGSVNWLPGVSQRLE